MSVTDVVTKPSRFRLVKAPKPNMYFMLVAADVTHPDRSKLASFSQL